MKIIFLSQLDGDFTGIFQIEAFSRYKYLKVLPQEVNVYTFFLRLP